MAAASISQFHHTPYYCEENVYMLCKKLCELRMAEPDASDLFVLFISNNNKQIPLWHQKASKRSDGLVIWDYHVICVQRILGSSPSVVWDLDSNLPLPTPLPLYISESIGSSFHLFSDYKRYFRIVHAPIFLKYFASDRRYMKDHDGGWIHPPPSYDPVTAADGSGTKHNLNEYMNISSMEVINNFEQDSINGVLCKKLGAVIGENLLEDFLQRVFSAIKSQCGFGVVEG